MTYTTVLVRQLRPVTACTVRYNKASQMESGLSGIHIAPQPHNHTSMI